MIPGTHLVVGLERGCRILMFIWPFGALVMLPLKVQSTHIWAIYHFYSES